jgi:hypothetical protein
MTMMATGHIVAVGTESVGTSIQGAMVGSYSSSNDASDGWLYPASCSGTDVFAESTAYISCNVDLSNANFYENIRGTNVRIANGVCNAEYTYEEI